MTGPLLFNPTRADLGELDAMLVARRPHVEKLIADLVSDTGRATRRHWQIVGPRGSGKSHITQLIALRLEALGWAIARLSEEQYRVNCVGDLLEQIVVRLEDTDESPLADVAAADLEDKAIDRIRTWRKQAGKPILVVVENLGMLFQRKLRDRRDQARLRELLGRDSPFTLLATATSFVDATTHHEAPLFHFFQPIVLDDLSVDEVTELILARARWDDEQGLLAQSERLRGRVRAMYHFTGGNPRLVMALYGVLRAGVTDELYQELHELLDAVTPYYQARLHDVAPQAERVLAEMALAGKQLTPSAIAKRCRMPTNQVTALVSKLEAERFIEPTGRPDGRSRYYDVSDRLFRIWMQMREDRTARARLRFLSDFYQRWYAGRPEEVDDAMKQTSTLLWTDVHEAATRKIRERLRTLDYLKDAVPSGTLMALRNVHVGQAPSSLEDAQSWLACLEPLRRDVEPFVRSVATLLAIPALARIEGDASREISGLLLENFDIGAIGFLVVSAAPTPWMHELIAWSEVSRAAREYLRVRAIALAERHMVELMRRVQVAVEPTLASVRSRIADWFRDGALRLIREQPHRVAEIVEFYEWVRVTGALESDVPLYAAVMAVRDDPEKLKELSPEVREAVELLLTPVATEEKVKPYRVETRGTASLAAEAEPAKAPKPRTRGKLRP